MSCNHPMGGKRAVPLDLPAEQKAILRGEFFGGLDSCLHDLKTPERLRDPAATAIEGAVFFRLLEALDEGEIAVPDEEAKARIDRLARSFDNEQEYEEVVATHRAHRTLLDVLGQTDHEEGPDYEA